MPAGKYDRRVTVEAVTESRSGIEVSGSWASAGSRWAQIKSLSGRELFEAKQVHEDAEYSITLRDELSGITTKHRITEGSNVFNIRAIADYTDRDPKHGEVCLCTKASN